MGMKRGLALAVAFGLFAGGPAPAHEGAESAGEGRVEPEVIPLHRIPALVDVSDRVLRQISALIRVDASIEVIEAALPDLQAIVAERSEGLAALLEGAPSRKRLSDSAADWAYRAGALDRWRRELSGRSEGLESSIQRLAVERATWELTLADARDAQAPETILHRLEALLARGHEIERLARERLTVVLTLQDHVAEQGLRVEEALDRIETAREEFRAELLVAEAEPLWRDLRRHDLGTHGGAVLESIRMDLRNLRGFVASNGPRLLLDLVIFILLLNAAFALRRRVAQWTEDDPPLGRAAVMLGRPVSLALLVSLLVFPSL
ncbi:MAG: hypothetical protein O7G30_03390, partial [Proteobacteria bacterium]|nr:hypothetical protein [Pseudomonadota bacterium]